MGMDGVKKIPTALSQILLFLLVYGNLRLDAKKRTDY
jgi:hypothetical protein